MLPVWEGCWWIWWVKRVLEVLICVQLWRGSVTFCAKATRMGDPKKNHREVICTDETNASTLAVAKNVDPLWSFYPVFPAFLHHPCWLSQRSRFLWSIFLWDTEHTFAGTSRTFHAHPFFVARLTSGKKKLFRGPTLAGKQNEMLPSLCGKNLNRSFSCCLTLNKRYRMVLERTPTTYSSSSKSSCRVLKGTLVFSTARNAIRFPL